MFKLPLWYYKQEIKFLQEMKNKMQYQSENVDRTTLE